MITQSTEYKLCVTMPDKNLRVVLQGNKKSMTAAAKQARGINPHLTYTVMNAPGKLLGDIIQRSGS